MNSEFRVGSNLKISVDMTAVARSESTLNLLIDRIYIVREFYIRVPKSDTYYQKLV